MKSSSKKIAERAKRVTPFYVMELLEKAKALEGNGEHIVHMEVGEPDFTTPYKIKEAAIRAINNDYCRYTHSLGIAELKGRIAGEYGHRFGIDCPPESIIITNGTSGALLLLFLVLLQEGMAIGISDPGYPCYKNFGVLTNAKIAPIPVTEETNYEITINHLQSIDICPDVLIIANPSNPTGTVYKEDNIARLYHFMADHGGILIVDEIYSSLVYKERMATALSISKDIIVVNGFSKSHAMTGWRLGWMVVPDLLVRPIQKMAQNIFISPPTISQYAAISAFDVEEDLERMRQVYRERRDYLLPALKELGFYIHVIPEGAFYIYAGIDRWEMDSMEFVERALGEAKVAITPGYDFGGFRAGQHVRFSYANSLDMLELGCKRLREWLKSI